MTDSKRIAVLIEEGFDDAELTELLGIARTTADCVVTVGSGSSESCRGKNGGVMPVSATIAEVKADDFDAVIVPGGYAPDEMRLCQGMVDLVSQADRLGKVIVAVSHGPQLLISADIVEGRRIASWPSIAIDLDNAGAIWSNDRIAVDGNIITLGNSEDLPLLAAALECTFESRSRRVTLVSQQSRNLVRLSWQQATARAAVPPPG